MGIEFELKFRATREQLEMVRNALTGQEQLIRMQTTYFDTPSGALSARRYTLRRRLENDKSICTLKYPVSGPGTGEAELECHSVEAAIAELCSQSGIRELPALVQEGLIAVCGARFTRIAKTVCWEGAVLEVALDEGVLMGGTKEIPLCEIEVELKSGTKEAAVTCGSFLQSRFCLIPEKKSKFRRALALAKGE